MFGRFVRNAGLIIFLNKQDLLKKKIEQGKRLGDYFPEYNNFALEQTDEYLRAKTFMKHKVVVSSYISFTTFLSKIIKHYRSHHFLKRSSSCFLKKKRFLHFFEHQTHKQKCDNVVNIKLVWNI